MEVRHGRLSFAARAATSAAKRELDIADREIKEGAIWYARVSGCSLSAGSVGGHGVSAGASVSPYPRVRAKLFLVGPPRDSRAEACQVCRVVTQRLTQELRDGDRHRAR